MAFVYPRAGHRGGSPSYQAQLNGRCSSRGAAQDGVLRPGGFTSSSGEAKTQIVSAAFSVEGEGRTVAVGHT